MKAILKFQKSEMYGFRQKYVEILGNPGTDVGQTGRGRDTGYYTILLTTRFHIKRRRTMTTNDNVIMSTKDWLVGCFGFNGPLRQYFSLYRAVSQRAGERGEKG